MYELALATIIYLCIYLHDHLFTHADIMIISLNPTSNAIIKPVPAVNVTCTSWPGSKEKCPENVCKMKREREGTWWIQCTGCDQWFHQRCAGVTKKAAKKDYYCPICK